MNKTTTFLKDRWWVILIVAVIAILMLIPTKTGLPGKSYEGCSNKNSEYKSYCVTTEIKSITRDDADLTSITVPIAFNDSNENVTFRLKDERGLKIGDAIFINIAEYDKRAYLFINRDSNMLVTIINQLLDSSQGAAAVIDLNTMMELDSKKS